MNYHVELFQSLLNDFLQGESALLTLEGDILAIRGTNPVTYGTLPTAALTATKYLQLQEGDIVILNDPYSGGSLLGEMTFVMAVSEDLIWVTRRPMEKKVKISKSVEEEGIRIPPTPLRQKNQLNEIIIDAIQAHPACPPHFKDWLKKQCQDLTEKAQKLIEAIELSGFTVTGELIEDYLELSKNAAWQKINERSSGETRVDVVLDSGELLRVSMDIHDGKITLDFGGTSSAKTVSLTESATLGACFYTLARFYGFEQIANSGSFSVLQLTKPSGCWLVGKYPAPTYKGMTCGVAALETALDMALSHIHQKGERALNSRCSLRFDLKNDSKNKVLTLHGGCGATPSEAGASAHTKAFSIEQLERDFPVKVQRIDHRQSMGGKGKNPGGRGLIMKFEIKDVVEGAWMTDLTLHRPRISKNCTHGDAGEILIERQGETKNLPVLGTQKFAPGDIVTLCSGSGGGYGKE